MDKLKLSKSKHPDKVILQIADIARQNGFEIYLVGGFVRDRLMGKECNDIDINVIGDAVKFAGLTAKEFKTNLNAVYKKFGTALLVLNDVKIEFASAREESYKTDSRKPEVKFSDLEHDLSRRDFTVNALAVSLNENNSGEIIDMVGGMSDLNNKLLKTPLDPIKTFDDDPLRMMRAARFASQLDFKIEQNTFEAIGGMKERLRISQDKQGVVSQERITDEFLKILQSQKPSAGLKSLQKSGLMEIIFPEVYALEGVDQRKDFHHKDVFYHTLQVIDNISKNTENVWLRFAALMHDIAKPPTKKFVEGTG